jgi:hypothetical protein
VGIVRDGGTVVPSGVVGVGTALERSGADSVSRVGATSGRRNSVAVWLPIGAGATMGAAGDSLGVFGSEFDMRCGPSSQRADSFPERCFSQ